MANWASTAYVIEGPKETLKKIYDAILHHDVEEGSSFNWEGNILNALNIKYEPRSVEHKGDTVIFSGYYMRGFIQMYTVEFRDTLSFCAEEAWGATDFHEVLEKNISNIKVFFTVEECGEEIYVTNDKEGKYFPYRFYVDTCIDGNYQQEYFVYKSDVFKWLHKITSGKVNTEEKVEEFNKEYETNDSLDENYISIHEFAVIEE